MVKYQSSRDALRLAKTLNPLDQTAADIFSVIEVLVSEVEGLRADLETLRTETGNA